jgi:hypothetical protein
MNRLLAFVLVLLPLVGCKQVIGGAIDTLPPPKPIKPIKGVVDDVPPPRVPDVDVPNSASAKITGFIKQAGKSAGKSYINQQVVNRLPVSKQSLADVIFTTALEELKRTGEVIVERQIRQMQREAIQAAIVAIAEYRQETGSQVEVVE